MSSTPPIMTLGSWQLGRGVLDPRAGTDEPIHALCVPHSFDVPRTVPHGVPHAMLSVSSFVECASIFSIHVDSPPDTPPQER